MFTTSIQKVVGESMLCSQTHRLRSPLTRHQTNNVKRVRDESRLIPHVRHDSSLQLKQTGSWEEISARTD